MVLKFGAGRGFGHGNRKSQGRRSTGPVVVNNSALDSYRTARTNRASAPASIMFSGDSWGEGCNTTTLANGYNHKVAAALEAAFPTAGVTGIGRCAYLPWDSANGGGTNAGLHIPIATTGTVAGQSSANISFADHRATFGALNNSVSYTITGDGFSVNYFDGSACSIGVQIDGVEQTAITCTNAFSPLVSSIYSMTPGTHTIKLYWKTGASSPNLIGLITYYGNQTKGFRFIDGTRSAQVAGSGVGAMYGVFDFINNNSQPDMKMWNYDLIVMNLSLTNDYNSQTALATFQSSVQATITKLRRGVSTRPVLLWAANAPNDQGAKAIPWTSYRDVYNTIAQSDPYVAFVDFSSVIPSAAADTGIWSFWDTDKLHPNDAGHTTLANLLATVLSS